MKSKEVKEKIENQSFNTGMIERLKKQIEAVEDTWEPKEFINNSFKERKGLEFYQDKPR